MRDDAIQRAVVLEALNRLNKYYSGRARSSLRVLQQGEETTLEKLIALGVSVAQWQGKQEAVVKVAENIGVTLKEVDAGTPQKPDDTALYDHIDSLKRVLGQIEERNGLVQSMDSFKYVQRLHKQARMHIDKIEQLEAERQ